MKSVIVVVFLLAQANAMSWADVFSPLEDSLGRLVSEVVTDIRDTIDCTILAVQRALSLDGLFGTSSEYEEKCGGQSAYATTQTSGTPWSDPVTSAQESNVQPESTNTKKQLSAEVDVSVSTVNKDIQSVIDQSTAKQTIQNVKESLKNETDRFSQISAVLKREVDKIPEAVRKKLNFDSDHTGVDDVVEEVKLLFETEQSNKDSAAAKAVRRVFYEVLTILNVTDVDVPLSEEEEVKLILTNIYQHSNNSLVDVEKQVSTWTKEDHRQITNIKNVLINVSKESSLNTNKTNENVNQSHAINKKAYEIDNHINVTSATQLMSDESKVAKNCETDLSAEMKHAKSKSKQITDQTNETNVSQTVTSITIHKTNKTTVEVLHNESNFSSAHLPQTNEHHSSMPPTTLVMSKNNSTADPVTSLLSKSLNAASSASNVSVMQSLTASSARFSENNLHYSNHTNGNSTRLSKIDSNPSAGLFSTELSKDLPKTFASPLPTSAEYITNSQTHSPEIKSSGVQPIHLTNSTSNTLTNGTSRQMLTDQKIGSTSEQELHLIVQSNVTQLNSTRDTFTLHSSSSANVSTTELEKLNDQLDDQPSTSPSKIAVTDATKSDTKTDPPQTQVHTNGQPDSNHGTTTCWPPKKTAVSSTPAARPKTITSAEPPPTKQYPKNFRDLTKHILDSSQSDNNLFNDYDDSASGRFDVGVLEQLFGPPVNAEQQEAVQKAKSIVENSLKSQEFIDRFFSKVDTKSEPSVFDDAEDFDF